LTDCQIVSVTGHNNSKHRQFDTEQIVADMGWENIAKIEDLNDDTSGEITIKFKVKDAADLEQIEQRLQSYLDDNVLTSQWDYQSLVPVA